MDLQAVQTVAIAALVVSMMLAIGMRTRPGEFAEVFTDRGTLARALVLNLLAVPLLAWGVCVGLGFREEVTVGLLLASASPGGATGPLFAAIAGAPLPLAVAVMVLLSGISIAAVPLAVAAGLGSATELDVTSLMLPMAGTLLVVQLTPLAAGMLTLARWPDAAARFAGPLNKVANLLLLLIIFGLLAARGGALLELGLTGVLACAGLALANLGLGALAGRDRGSRRSLALVTAVRNLSLALLLSAAFFPDPLTDASVLTFGLFTMLVPALVAALWRR
jgi:BASS family bile acid:Na+ symporter